MNRLVVSFLLVCVVIFVQAHEKKQRANLPYPPKYNNFDVDPVIKNERIFKNYIDCCLGKGKCTSDGLILKDHLKDAIEYECDKCTETQKKNAKKVIRKLIKEKPDWWEELCNYFDPDHKLRTKYQKEHDKVIAGEYDNL